MQGKMKKKNKLCGLVAVECENENYTFSDCKHINWFKLCQTKNDNIHFLQRKEKKIKANEEELKRNSNKNG